MFYSWPWSRVSASGRVLRWATNWSELRRNWPSFSFHWLIFLFYFYDYYYWRKCVSVSVSTSAFRLSKHYCWLITVVLVVDFFFYFLAQQIPTVYLPCTYLNIYNTTRRFSTLHTHTHMRSRVSFYHNRNSQKWKEEEKRKIKENKSEDVLRAV